ncbi:MAG: gliding motility-associated C-terminal domain-containing protein [Saprospiraceae bacterium]
MKIIKYKLLLLLLLGGIVQLDAQRIVRSTLCSTGRTLSNNSTTLRSTFGQCPGCNKIGNDNTSVYQGFQQPIQSTIAGNSSVPCFQSDFAVEAISTECGTYFMFEYLGNADPELTDFQWDFGGTGLPSTSFEANPMNIAFSEIGNTIISLTVSQDTCTETVRKSINVTATGFGFDFTVDDVRCSTDTDGQIELTIIGGQEPYQVNWSDEATDIIRDNLAAGEYAITVLDANNCEFTAVGLVSAPDSLAVTFNVINESTAGAGDGSIDAFVTGGTAPYTFIWGDGAIAQNRTSVTSGRYEVIISDANGCSITETLEFGTFEGGAGLEGSSEQVITPNADGINDFFIVKDIEQYPDNEVFIYNRWGQIVYSIEGYTNNWTGTNAKGEDLQTGAYWYIVKLNDASNIQFSGAVTIVR